MNHRYNFVDPHTHAHTQNVERLWRSAKERNKRQNGTRREMLESYFCEFLWRQEMKRRDVNQFDEILRNIVEFSPPV